LVLGVSVIICSYNGAARLPKTLQHLALQQVPAEDIPWEIIIVDNASTDGTTSIAKTEWSNYNLPDVGFKVLQQNRPGKNYAFELGVKEARYEFILTCDDDNWLYPNYVATAFKTMQADTSIGALGGQGIFEPEQPAADGIEKFKEFYVTGPQTWAPEQHWVYGAGSVYKKCVFIDLINSGWQQITTGRQGTKLVCGEDVEICFMIYLMGYKVIAYDKLLFKHFVPLKRQSENYIIKLNFWLSYSNVLLNSYFSILHNDKRPIKSVINKWFLSSTLTVIKNTLSLVYQKIKTRNSLTIKQKIFYNNGYGIWYALFLNRKKIIDHHNRVKALLKLQLANKTT